MTATASGPERPAQPAAPHARPHGVTHWDGPGLDAWRPWTPAEAAVRLTGVDVPWCVVGGWAIDLFVGERTRPHEDLEIAIPRQHLAAVRRALAGYRFHVVGQGEVRALPDGDEPPADRYQNWVLDEQAQVWRVDVMLEPGDADTWVYRRDPGVRAPRPDMVGRTGDGVPFLQPHATLLCKAKAARPKDEHDFAVCLPLLPGAARAWLAGALAHAHPGHPWIAALA